MKLSEIKTTKKDFLNMLKDPEVAKMRRKIKEFRKSLSKWDWIIISRFDKIQRIFTIRVHIPFDRETYIDLIAGRMPSKKEQVFKAIQEVFDANDYKIDIQQRQADDIIFWVYVKQL